MTVGPCFQDQLCFSLVTRLHSSRMRTARALTLSPSIFSAPGGGSLLGGCTWSRGVYLVPGGVPGPGGGVCSRGCTWSWWGCLLRGVYLSGGCVCSRGVYLVRYCPPPPRGQTDACKLVTLPQISFAGGKNELLSNIFNADTPTVHWPVVLQFMSSDGWASAKHKFYCISRLLHSWFLQCFTCGHLRVNAVRLYTKGPPLSKKRMDALYFSSICITPESGTYCL